MNTLGSIKLTFLLLASHKNVAPPTAHELNHIIAAAKHAAQQVFLAQQHVNAAKEDVLVSQKLVKEKEAQALIAHRKSESAQHVLRSEAQNGILAQQKLAKLKSFAAEQQLKQAIKDAEAARAIQNSAHYAQTEITKAEEVAHFAHLKRQHFPAYPKATPFAFNHQFPPPAGEFGGPHFAPKIPQHPWRQF